MNRERMEAGLRLFLEGLIETPSLAADLGGSEALAAIPARVASAWSQDLLAGYRQEPAEVLEAIPIAGARGPVVLSGLRFSSVCGHHLLPFSGEALVAFLPARTHTGLGNLARLIDCLARRLTLQERLCAQIADEIVRALNPKATLVRLEAEHSCLSARGARKIGHRFRTEERRGEDPHDLATLLSAL